MAYKLRVGLGHTLKTLASFSDGKSLETRLRLMPVAQASKISGMAYKLRVELGPTLKMLVSFSDGEFSEMRLGSMLVIERKGRINWQKGQQAHERRGSWGRWESVRPDEFSDAEVSHFGLHVVVWTKARMDIGFALNGYQIIRGN
jgi:hypothetical protein